MSFRCIIASSSVNGLEHSYHAVDWISGHEFEKELPRLHGRRKNGGPVFWLPAQLAVMERRETDRRKFRGLPSDRGCISLGILTQPRKCSGVRAWDDTDAICGLISLLENHCPETDSHNFRCFRQSGDATRERNSRSVIGSRPNSTRGRNRIAS